MGPTHDDREPQGEPPREALVDLKVKLQPGEPSAGSMLRRKRLSDMEPEDEKALPQKEPTREPLADLNVKPPQSGEPSAGLNLRRKRLSDREPEGEKTSSQREPTREPLVDLNAKPPQSREPSVGLNLRRKRLSDREPEGNEAPPQPQTGRQRRRLLAPSEAGSDQPPCEPEPGSEPRRPRLVTVLTPPELTASETATPQIATPEAATPKGAGLEGTTPEEQEPRLKVGRARVTITQSPEDPAGLQNIIDPPRSLSAVLAPGQHEIEVMVPDRQVKQGLSVALAGGVTAALAAALVWALITMATGYHAGWMAIGMGLLIGGAVRTMARGEGKSFGYLGAAVWILGCALGDLLSVCALVASQESLSLVTVLLHICRKPAMIPDATLATFQFLDLLFWVVGIYAAYRLSFRRIRAAETAADSGK